MLVTETGEALGRIVAQVVEINTVIADIAASAQEQATGLDQVNTAVNQMDQVTQKNAAMVEETTAAAHGLAGESEELGRSGCALQDSPGRGRPAARRTEKSGAACLPRAGKGGRRLAPRRRRAPSPSRFAAPADESRRQRLGIAGRSGRDTETGRSSDRGARRIESAGSPRLRLSEINSVRART